MRTPLTTADLRLIAMLVLATVLAFPMASMAGGHGDGTATISGPHGDTVVALDQPARYDVQGQEGTVVFEVSEGSLFCVESSCEEQICVRQHEVRQGRPVVCAPNGVAALLTARHEASSEEGDLDAVSR
jgi:hypothetical protein